LRFFRALHHKQPTQHFQKPVFAFGIDGMTEKIQGELTHWRNQMMIYSPPWEYSITEIEGLTAWEMKRYVESIIEAQQKKQRQAAVSKPKKKWSEPTKQMTTITGDKITVPDWL